MNNIELVMPCPKCSVFIRFESKLLGTPLCCPGCKEEVILTDEKVSSKSPPKKSMIDKAMNFINKDNSEMMLKERAEKREKELNRRKELNVVVIERLQKDVAWGVFWGLVLFTFVLPIFIFAFWVFMSIVGVSLLAN
jgi:hypothetical protein